MRKIIVLILTRIIYLWGSIWYDNKYFYGKYFNKYHLSNGWKWILKYWFPQKVLGYGRGIPFPIPRNVTISGIKNIHFDSNDMDNFFSPGCYFQAFAGEIHIGKGTLIAPNCGFITANHDINNIEKHSKGKNIIIGEKCWIGMNSVILPGVVLGNNTIVGAGSIVAKSFPEGNCIIAGNPAKIIRKIEND